MKNKIQSLINYGWQKNAIFQDCYKNLMRLSRDESHLSEVTMSPQKSILDQFNGFLDRYLENMMRQHCFGWWINESIPYELESSNTKSVQLLTKTIVEKLDNEEYLPNKDGGTSPKIKFMNKYYTPTLKVSFVINAILILIIHSLLIMRMKSVSWKRKDIIFGERMLKKNWINSKMILKI